MTHSFPTRRSSELPAANAVDAEGVERVVIAEPGLEHGHRIETDDRGDRAEDDGAERSRVARGRRDRDEAGNDARAEAESRALVAVEALREHPEDRKSTRLNSSH